VIRAHTLEEVVEAGWAPSVHFLTVRLRRGEIRGRKVGHGWRMTDADVQALADSMVNAPASLAEVPRAGLSVASARRRSA
jgi:hypothetical protein